MCALIDELTGDCVTDCIDGKLSDLSSFTAICDSNSSVDCDALGERSGTDATKAFDLMMSENSDNLCTAITEYPHCMWDPDEQTCDNLNLAIAMCTACLADRNCDEIFD